MLLKTFRSKTAITKPLDVLPVFKALLDNTDEADKDREHLYVAGLDGRNTVKYVELVSLGTLNASLVHPRETFRLAITRACAGIICCHNHPSGDCTPSEDDLEITKRLVDSGKLLGIEVLDHIIMGKNSFLSFKDKGLI